jgi:ankyrin repeat protein
LHWAAFDGRPAIAKRLLEGGADATLRDINGKTAIDWARENGKSEVVTLLSEPRYADGDRTECEPNAESNAKSIANRNENRNSGRRRLGRTRTRVYLPLGE